MLILVVAYIGFFEIILKFRKTRRKVDEIEDVDAIEGVSILRPIKGIDPELYTCLESSFIQKYPERLIQILFCVDDPEDQSIPIIKQLIEKYPHLDAEILISEGYDLETQISNEHYGPNPKVNNLAKGFQKAKYDILWIMDSNVWALPDTLANSVMALNQNTNNGRKNTSSRKIKLVHHVPLALSIGSCDEGITELGNSIQNSLHSKCTYFKTFGARLDEMFLMTSHLKFYISLNNLSIAPCVNGKSNIYRKSDLDKAVARIPLQKSSFFNSASTLSDARELSSMGAGNSIKFFSRYIAEDNMIAICLWENLHSKTGLCGDFVIQPLGGMDNSVKDYMTRRVRWLRVRKYMVFAATLIEPTTESIVCGIFGTYALSTLFWHEWFNFKYFAFHIFLWMLTDYIQYYSFIDTIAASNYRVSWLKKENLPPLKNSFLSWLYIWLMREVLALPIWINALCGQKIFWRGKPFKIKQDLTAEEL